MIEVEAAVLVPLVRADDGDRLILVRRGPSGVHGGLLALPGGRREEGDPSPWATAIREAAEETGLDPEEVTLLDELPIVEDRSSGMLIAPFLAEIVRPIEWRPGDGEIVEVIEVPVADLADPRRRGEGPVEFPAWSEPRHVPYIALGEDRIWGLTYRVLEPILALLVPADRAEG
jgi:8-oxo-dGTP pyrophosphatase MutT (NUDIX family)